MPAHFYPVILAGGRGTRFWPLSRKKRAKQLLALDGNETMIQQTVARLLPLAPTKRIWIIGKAPQFVAVKLNAGSLNCIPNLGLAQLGSRVETARPGR